ncbi:MAG: AMP-binding protein [Actinobacteria bacterium]|nr:AMP-binding protein [Actinomycetota bacterium]
MRSIPKAPNQPYGRILLERRVTGLAIHPSSIIQRAGTLHPGREAIVWGSERVTYGELAHRADELGARLGAGGVTPGARIALIGRNSVGYAVALLGLARHGFTSVPLNWRLPGPLLAETAAKYRPEALLFTPDFAQMAHEVAAAVPGIRVVLCVDPDDGERAEGGRAEALLAGVSREPQRDDVFAFISTGGTEGVPKGVPVTNAMLEASVLSMLTVEPLDETDVVMVLPQMFHNPHLYLIGPLLVGGRLVVPEMESFDAELLLRTVETEGVGRFIGVATMMNFLLDAQERLGADLGSLRTISYGGAPFPARLIERIMRVFDCDLLQLYGQTETSVLISALTPADHRAALSDPDRAHLVRSAGRPVPLVEARVVDDEGRDCPQDRATVGEILVRSPSVMHGYHEDPERTAQKLVDGWCLTGDLATWDEDGYLYIVDRRNDLIRSGGESVFPSAVETVIRELPAVQEVVVIGTPDEVWGQIVTAVVLPREGASITEAEITALCGKRLASYMRPRIVHIAADLPRNPSGKVLRGEVKEIYSASSTSS